MQATEPQGDDKHKRTHHRSPAYPMLKLEDAIEKARTIYNADKRSYTSRPVIVQHLGYKDENSGVGNRELSALRQYGLLEEKGGEYRVSDTAYAILFLSDASDGRGAALAQAALSPTIFKDLWAKYRSDASEGTLKDFLIHKREFNPASVDQVVSNYKATIMFAKLTNVSHTEAEEDQESPELLEVQERQPTRPHQAPQPPISSPPQSSLPGWKPVIGKVNIQQDVFTLTEGPVTIQWPESLSPESYEDLRDWLDIMKRKIGRSIKDRRQAQKDRIVQAVRKLNSAALLKFEDHGQFIWFRVTTPDGTTLLIPYSGDQDAEFYEGKSEDELVEYIHLLSNQRL